MSKFLGISETISGEMKIVKHDIEIRYKDSEGDEDFHYVIVDEYIADDVLDSSFSWEDEDSKDVQIALEILNMGPSEALDFILKECGLS